MKYDTKPLLILVFFLPTLACAALRPVSHVEGSGNIVKQIVNVSNFDRVTLAASGDVYIEQGNTESLTIEADDNILPLLDTRVRGNELVLDIKPNQSIHPSTPVVYRLTVKNLSGLSLRGSGNFYVDSVNSKEIKLAIPGSGNISLKELVGKILTLDIHGSGNISIDQLQVKTVETSLSGSGDINLHGTAKSQEISIGGSGNYLAGDLETTLAEIKIPGSGDVTVWATENLRVKINGHGSVHYYGTPAIDQSIAGSGEISRLGEQ